jgi:hypothetical protein
MESRPAAEGLRERRLVGPSGSSVESSAGAPRPASRGTPRPLHPQVIAAEIEDVLNLLLVFRFINSLCVRTFFQPDEYFQALEPAWSIAFGSNSGAWLTWVGARVVGVGAAAVADGDNPCPIPPNAGMATPAQIVAAPGSLRAGLQGCRRPHDHPESDPA